MPKSQVVVVVRDGGAPFVRLRYEQYSGPDLERFIGQRIVVRECADDPFILEVMGPSGEIVTQLTRRRRSRRVRSGTASVYVSPNDISVRLARMGSLRLASEDPIPGYLDWLKIRAK